MAKNFPNQMKTMNPQIQEAQQEPSARNKENYSETHQNRLKTSKKREKLKSCQRGKKKQLYREEQR